jgi:hypothetical protein
MSATVRTVWPDGTGDYPTIQAALNAAESGDKVLLTDGVFRGTGNRELDFHGKAVVLRSQSGDTSSVVIDCQATGRAFRFYSGETRATRIEGLTVKMAVQGGPGVGGGAIACEFSGPSFRNCAFHECISTHGCVVMAWHASPVFQGCRFYDNGITGPGQGGVFWAE